MNGVGRLRDGVTLEAAQQELDGLARQIEREFPVSNANTTFLAMTLQESLVGAVQRPLYLLLGAIFLVLLYCLRKRGESAAGAWLGAQVRKSPCVSRWALHAADCWRNF
jgi:hypothetical protein